MPATDASTHVSRIFISYRREDSDWAASRLADDLCRQFTREQVFQDFASIDPGADFVEAVQRGLDTCAAVLVVIGPKWLNIVDRKGRRRLDVSGDWVRHEVGESLRRRGVRVFPVLLGDTQMPDVEDLPEDLQALTRRQAFPLTVRHWAKDVAELIGHLQRVAGLDRTSSPADPDHPPVPSPSTTPPTASPQRAAATDTCEVLRGDAWVKSRVVAPELPAGTVFRDAADLPEMVVIPAGRFLMGSPQGEAGRSGAEGPQHEVTIARPFAVGRYAVTFDQWDACVAAGGCKQKPGDKGWGRGRRPVINVSWEDAQAYVAWLMKKTGKGYRLLSEAEWEYAARAGGTTAYPWGQEPGTNRANFNDSGSQWSGKQTAPVGSFAPNAFGLYDMIGNVWEWTQDCWNESYAGAPADGSPWLKGECGRRVVRGGSWNYTPVIARAAFRNWVVPGSRNYYQGFRLARTL